MNECARYGLVVTVFLTFACSSTSGTGSAVRGNGGSTGEGGSGIITGNGGSGIITGSGGNGIITGGGDSSGGADAGGATGMSCNGKLTGYIRDFLAAQSPDFEPFPPKPGDVVFPNRMPGKLDKNMIEPNIVDTMLGADKKPVYKLGDGTTSWTTTGSANFQTWFHDTDGINKGQALDLQFTKDPTDPTGATYKYDSAPNGFFPIDMQLLGNEGRTHNFSFTFEMHTRFTYVKGQTFHFRGDDDVWAFIDSKRVIDIGGIHDAFTQDVNLDTLGLTEGKEYPLDFFFAERHVYASDFLCETTIDFTNCGDVTVK